MTRSIDPHEALDIFLIYLKDKGHAPSTQREYLYNVRAYLHTLEGKPLEATRKLDVLQFLTQERVQGNAPSTRNRKLMAIRAFYKALIEMEFLNENPTAEIEMAKVPKNRIPTYLDLEAWQAFLRQIPEGEYALRNKTIFMLMATAGLRVSEVRNLDLANIHRDGPGIEVHGKGNKTRYVPITETLYQHLQAVIRYRLAPKPSARHALFVSREGTRLSTRRIQQITEEVFTRLQQTPGFEYLEGLPLSAHKLRHTFGTNLILNGVDLRTAQELLGHESVATTEIYTHVTDERKEEAIRKLGVFMDPPQ